jgi:hypothetical protein
MNAPNSTIANTMSAARACWSAGRRARAGEGTRASLTTSVASWSVIARLLAIAQVRRPVNVTRPSERLPSLLVGLARRERFVGSLVRSLRSTPHTAPRGDFA